MENHENSFSEFPLLFDAETAARALNVSSSFLAKLRVSGGGPRYIKIGRRVAYRAADLDSWLAERARTNTSQAVN